jgi:hypothetical protein
LPGEAPAAGSEGGSNGDFLLARGGAGEKKICDVGAGDEEQKSDSSEENG